MSEEGVKPDARSRRITVMGRRRSRAPGEGEGEDTSPGAEHVAEGGDMRPISVEVEEDARITQDLAEDFANASEEPPDEREKTNPRARADEIAATLSRLTPEPEDVRTNPRIVIEAISGAPRSRDENAPRPAVVIAQARIISDAPRAPSEEDAIAEARSRMVPIAPVLRTSVVSRPLPSPNLGPRPSAPVTPSPPPQRPSLLNVGPAVAAFEAEEAAAKSEPPPPPSAAAPAIAAAPLGALADLSTDSYSDIAEPITAPQLALDADELSAASMPSAPAEPVEPWVDLETDALETDPGVAATPLLLDDDENQARSANTPPPPPIDLATKAGSSAPGAAPRKPPPPPATAAGAAAKPAEEDKKRKRVRQWWERFFSDDYLLTVPAPSGPQISKQVDFIEASLGLPKGAMILDVGCGLGLHSIELTRRGYLVVGLDLSLAMITRAAETAQGQGLKLNFLHADIREIAFDGAFDAVICMGTTFGFFDDDANRDVLTRLYQALRPGGRILLDCVNRDYVVRWQPNLVWFEGDGCVCMEESDFNYFNSRLVVKRTVMREDGQQSNSEYSLRAYSLHELGQLTQALGFRVIEVSGQEATRGVFFGNCSTRILMLAERRVSTARGSVVMPPERSTGEVPKPPPKS